MSASPKKLHVPAAIHHKRSGQDILFVRDAAGKRRMVYLGEHGSTAAARRYREVLAEHLAGRTVATRSKPAAPSGAPTVAQLCAAFLLHAERFYVDAAGVQSREVDNFRLALRPLLDLHRDTTTDRFTVADLGTIRQTLVDTEFGHKHDDEGKVIPGTGRKRTRTYVNATMRRIKQVFRWGTEQRLVPGATWHEISAMRGLPIGRCGAREAPPVEAVPWKLVESILEHLPSPLAAAVLLQWHAGMRPTEALTIRTCDVDRRGEQWTYRPERHKGQHLGRQRLVAFGPKAQEVLRPLLKADPKAYLISPRDSLTEHRAELRARRETPPTKQTLDRDARTAAAPPSVGERYDVNTYRRAIHRACDVAGVPRWSPHRLRHACGTRLVLEAGIEGARAALGHADDRMTRRYSVAAEARLAAEVAGKHG